MKKSKWATFVAIVAICMISSTVHAEETSQKTSFEAGKASDLLGSTTEPGADRKPTAKASPVSLQVSCRLPGGQVIDRLHPQFDQCLQQSGRKRKDSSNPIPINM